MIGILLISTRKYKQFCQSLISQIDEFFLPDHQKTIFLFTDEYQNELKSKSELSQTLIPDYKFPYATLYRYRIFSQNETKLKTCSHLFYLDIDMAVVSEVGNEFITDGLLAVKHPGFYSNNGWGDSNNPKESTSYMPPEKRRHYFCGGVQGGTSEAYIQLSKTLSENIDEDEKKGIIAEWNDETHYNSYINWKKPEGVSVTELNSSYCMPEPERLRKLWGIDHLPAIILALDKNHSEIRN